MSGNTSLNIRVDSDLKQQAEALFADLGLNMTTAVNIFLRQSLQRHGLPFDVALKVPNAETLAAMLESEIMINDPDTKGFDSVEELFKDLEL